MEQQWETARLQFETSGSEDFILAIDEIQKISNWSEVVKKLWDEENTMLKLGYNRCTGIQFIDDDKDSLVGESDESGILSSE